MKNISTHLWFDKEAKEAADFYISLFKGAKVTSSSVINNTPSGDVDIVSISLPGQDFTLIGGGPYFKFTPAVSFLVACQTKLEVDMLWAPLLAGGSTLMELGQYPFSQWYGWLQDRYGLSWQIMLMGDIPSAQKITPTMMFAGDIAGRAEEAMEYYTSVFAGAAGAVAAESSLLDIMRYEKGEEPDTAGKIKHASFRLLGQYFAAMDSAREHKFNFNEAISFMVHCDDQAEIDYYWAALSAVPDAEQCGWLKDKYGFSWQIVPNAMDEMMSQGDKEQIARVTDAFLKMKKFDLSILRKAYDGR